MTQEVEVDLRLRRNLDIRTRKIYKSKARRENGYAI